MFELLIDHRVAELTMCRPPVNALSEEWGEAFEDQLDQLEKRDDWTVLLLRSNQKVFAAGADLAQIHSWTALDDPGSRLSAYVTRLQGTFGRLESLSRVSVAEIGGAALGGGLELALSCDIRIAAFEAKLGLPEVGLGLIPGLGGTQRLTRLAGAGVAKRIMLSAELIDGRLANQLGIVEYATERGELKALTDSVARRIASMPRAALASAKDLVAKAGVQGDAGFIQERADGGRLLNTPEARQRVEAFLKKSATKH